jgi:hypothetical protein
MTIREKLETVLTNHVDDIAILSEELNFLRGAGSIGNLLPTGSKLHSTSKSKQRKISWDLPEIGDIWYNMKYYNQLVILIQDQLSESASGVAKLNERKLAHSNRLMEILRKFDNLYFKIFEQVKKSNPIIIDYMANKTSVQKTSSNESIKLANVPFFDTSNLPKLPSTLGIFTLMYASANSVKQSLITKLTPSSIIKNSIPDKKSRGAVILQGVTWCEVIIAISTGTIIPSFLNPVYKCNYSCFCCGYCGTCRWIPSCASSRRRFRFSHSIKICCRQGILLFNHCYCRDSYII